MIKRLLRSLRKLLRKTIISEQCFRLSAAGVHRKTKVQISVGNKLWTQQTDACNMLRTDTKRYKPTTTNMTKEGKRNKSRQKEKASSENYGRRRRRRRRRHTRARARNLLSRYKEKKVVIGTVIFYMAPKILWGYRRTDKTLLQSLGWFILRVLNDAGSSSYVVLKGLEVDGW